MTAEKDFNGYTAKQRAAIVENCTAIDREQAFRDMLDDCYGETEIAGMKYQTSRVLEEVDPIAFRCGVNDYFGNGDYVEVEGGTYHKDDADKAAGQIDDAE
jgi:hypothetical protein